MGSHVIENKSGEAVNLIPPITFDRYVPNLCSFVDHTDNHSGNYETQKHIMYPAAPDEPMKVMSVADNPTL